MIKFQDKNGNSFEFESSTSTPRTTTIGQSVNVRYLPQDPGKAKIDSFFGIWAISLFLAIFGVVFTGLGIPFFWLGIRDQINEKKALAYSKEITATVKEVTQNTSISMNGKSPYQITAQWLNPATNEVHVFKSKNIW